MIGVLRTTLDVGGFGLDTSPTLNVGLTVPEKAKIILVFSGIEYSCDTG
jgi:hypothetical protein